MSTTFDTIVVGAGPAGMSAAAALAERGLAVIVVDQQRTPGGQIYRNLGDNLANDKRMAILGPDYASGKPLLERLYASGAKLAMGRTVWRLDAGATVWARCEHRIERLDARSVIIATGAQERPCPIPGWTLPGVMSVGALQIMLKSSGLVPDGQIVLAGTGPLFYLYAAQCLKAGLSRLTLLDLQTHNRRHATAHFPGALRGRGPRYLWKGLAMLQALRQPGVRIHRHVRRVEIEGNDRVDAVSFDTPAGRQHCRANLVALHDGILPNIQLSRAAGCRHTWDAGDYAFRPDLTDQGETSKADIFVCGDSGGIIGAAASAIDGELVALAVAARLNKVDEPARQRLATRLLRAKAAELAARPFINALYHPANRLHELPDRAVVCRCESITSDAIRNAVQYGASGPDQVKAYTRAGMGPCQGRMCGAAVNRLLASEKKVPESDAGYFNLRSPIVPISAAHLADYANEIAYDE